MTVDEARRILQAESCTSLRELRRNYLRLMKECHPDNKAEYGTGLDPRLLNEAYHMLLQIPFPVPAQWDAELAEDAFCERVIYDFHVFEDGLAHKVAITHGKYLWNPEAEDFSMLLASVHEAARKLVDAESPRLFHFLLQEFVDPIYALRKLKKIDDAWTFRCDLPERTRKSPGCSNFSVRANESKIYAVDGSRNKEYAISFRDKSLYYIITPLVAAGAAQADVNADGNRLRLSVKDNSFQRDYKTANAIIETEIRKFR